MKNKEERGKRKEERGKRKEERGKRKEERGKRGQLTQKSVLILCRFWRNNNAKILLEKEQSTRQKRIQMRQTLNRQLLLIPSWAVHEHILERVATSSILEHHPEFLERIQVDLLNGNVTPPAPPFVPL